MVIPATELHELHESHGAARGAESRSPQAGLVVAPGDVAVLLGEPGYGLTRVGLSLLAAHAGHGPVAFLDVRGWLCPLAAWEMGIDPGRFLVARCNDVTTWGRAAAALLDGVQALYAEVPRGVSEQVLRKLGALARRRRTPLVLRPLHGRAPSGIATLTISAQAVSWEGADRGHGRIRTRRGRLELSGKAVRGMTRLVEVEDDGASPVYLVSDVGVAEAGRPR